VGHAANGKLYGEEHHSVQADTSNTELQFPTYEGDLSIRRSGCLCSEHI
jgi:hypothetical protein